MLCMVPSQAVSHYNFLFSAYPVLVELYGGRLENLFQLGVSLQSLLVIIFPVQSPRSYQWWSHLACEDPHELPWYIVAENAVPFRWWLARQHIQMSTCPQLQTSLKLPSFGFGLFGSLDCLSLVCCGCKIFITHDLRFDFWFTTSKCSGLTEEKLKRLRNVTTCVPISSLLFPVVRTPPKSWHCGSRPFDS